MGPKPAGDHLGGEGPPLRLGGEPRHGGIRIVEQGGQGGVIAGQAPGGGGPDDGIGIAGQGREGVGVSDPGEAPGGAGPVRAAEQPREARPVGQVVEGDGLSGFSEGDQGLAIGAGLGGGPDQGRGHVIASGLSGGDGVAQRLGGQRRRLAEQRLGGPAGHLVVHVAQGEDQGGPRRRRGGAGPPHSDLTVAEAVAEGGLPIFGEDREHPGGGAPGPSGLLRIAQDRAQDRLHQGRPHLGEGAGGAAPGALVGGVQGPGQGLHRGHGAPLDEGTSGGVSDEGILAVERDL